MYKWNRNTILFVLEYMNFASTSMCVLWKNDSQLSISAWEPSWEPSLDVRIWRLKTVPALKELNKL